MRADSHGLLSEDGSKATLVVLGTGFAAFSLIKEIDVDAYEVTVVSPRNHFLFTPLLPSTTVGTIEFRSIIEPIRTARERIQFYQAWCTDIDIQKRTIQCQHALDKTMFILPYDILVIAVGATNNTYGIPGVEQNALFLKELADARAIRQRIIECFERASIPELSEERRKRLLHFLIVGGGPTGIEFAAEMHDFLVEDLREIFPSLIDDVRITILEAAEHILSTFDATLSAYTIKHFERQKIEVLTKSGVVKVDAEQVFLQDGSTVPYGLLIWSTGIGSTLLVQSLAVLKDKHARIVVDQYLRIQGFTNLYALGDCATFHDRMLPATAQVAQQEGRYVARALNRLAKGKQLEPFRYKDWGMLAYIGSHRALADLAAVKGRGFATWLFWRSVYLTRLVSFKNKILVVLDWMKTLIFGRDISRF
ncbi:MAG: FAD-dependent oxidoreductase [Ignavibacteriae bacterium]|nr:FAD-dependent oxidoreductase [Ignavibacteriota bacterium]